MNNNKKKIIMDFMLWHSGDETMSNNDDIEQIVDLYLSKTFNLQGMASDIQKEMNDFDEESKRRSGQAQIDFGKMHFD